MTSPQYDNNSTYSNSQYGQDSYGQGAYGEQPQYQGLQQDSKKALWGMICSIIGFFLCGILSIVGIILGFQAQNEIKTSGGRIGGSGKAKAAIIIGFISVALNILGGVLYVVQNSN